MGTNSATRKEGAQDGKPTVSLNQLFPGDGEMAQLMRAMDWARTPLGPVEAWPQTLRATISLCLSSLFPIVLWWGPELCVFYNDAYRPSLGASKHPALGKPGREVWPEVWPTIGPLLDGVMARGASTLSLDQLLPLDRNGFLEEVYFTYAYTPIRLETGTVGGVFCTVTETTAKVLAERRTRARRDVASALVDAQTAEEVCERAMRALGPNVPDIPFALLYLLDPERQRAYLAASFGLDGARDASDVGGVGRRLAAPVVALQAARPGAGIPAAVARVALTNQREALALAPSAWGATRIHMRQTEYDLTPQTALVLPIAEPARSAPSAVLVAGVSRMLVLDDEYEGFCELLVSHLSAGLAAAHAFEDARRRAEALAEIDRAKTAFFSNVSHEFRTPLTLLLGPLEDSLADSEQPLPERQRERLEVMRRNGVRLLKLVNTLLDFARIEAGRAQARYAATDLARTTAELASAFRSLIEKAGMRLVVDCPPLAGLRAPVYVDREMWEKVVLNLLSNAFKFTFAGEIAVRLRARGGGRAVELEVRDSGVGIPADELPRLFERFHRVEGAHARTHEGSGIGLALVRDLVHLHGGTVRAESQEGVGTAFFVRMPVGAAHLPAERVEADRQLTSTALGAAAFVEEALRWLPDEQGQDNWPDNVAGLTADAVPPADAGTNKGETVGGVSRVLLADDNADMRDYLRRLLGERYAVDAVANGQQALDVIRRAAHRGEALPDLVLSDVMMPELDGFGVLRALRADPATREIPVILLSARAGEEATVEGLAAGADDYLVKPFAAREVLSRVAARLEIARARRDAEARARELEATFAAMADGVAIYDAAGHILGLNPAIRQLLGLDDDYIAQAVGQRVPRLRLRDEDGRLLPESQTPPARVIRGETFTGASGMDVVARTLDGREIALNVSGAPLRDSAGRIVGGVCVYRDVTVRRRLERAARESERHLRGILELLPVGVAFVDASGKAWLVNGAVKAIWGGPMPLAESVAAYGAYRAWWPATGQRVAADEWGVARAIATGVASLNEEVEIEAFDGTRKTILCSDAPLRDETGTIVGAMSVIVDITERKRLEQRTRGALDALLELAAAMVSGFPTSEGGSQIAVAGSGDHTEEILTHFATLCTQVLACERIAIIAMAPETGLLRTVAITGSATEREQRFRAEVAGLRLAARFGAEITAQLYAGETVLIDVGDMPAEDPARILSRRLFLIAPIVTVGVLHGYVGVRFGDEEASYTTENRALALVVAQLVGIVMERARLTHARAEAEAREAALAETTRRMDEFLGIASHELRTPLTSITANVQLAGRQLRATWQDAEHRAALNGLRGRLERAGLLMERTDRQLGRLERLVSDLLDVSRIQAGKLEMRPEECDPLELVREAVMEQRAAWPKRGIALALPRGAGVLVHADADRIGQVVTNYLTNALKYSAADRPVAVRVRTRGGCLRVEVRDRGPGLTPEQQEHLFERFYRVPGIEQLTGSGVGLGLGLHICKTIVERHGGQVGLESTPGEGSTFWFTLPLSDVGRSRMRSERGARTEEV